MDYNYCIVVLFWTVGVLKWSVGILFLCEAREKSKKKGKKASILHDKHSKVKWKPKLIYNI